MNLNDYLRKFKLLWILILKTSPKIFKFLDENIRKKNFWSWAWQAFPIQFNSVSQSCPTLCDPIECSTPGLPVHHQLPEHAQTHVRWVGDATNLPILYGPLQLPPSIFPSISVLSSESVFTSGSYVLEFQPQHQSFQWTSRTDII